MKSGTIRLNDVTIAYDHQPAVRHVSGSFEPGSLTAIAGPNGAGKSTLLKGLMGELRLYEGSIDLGGAAARDFAYLPQAAEIDRRFPLTVADTVMLGAWRQTGAFRGATPASAARVRQALKAVGMSGFERRYIGSLSAGQFQRVLFARLLMQDAKVIVLDEPFAAIDARTTDDLLKIVRHWHEDGRTVIAVLHDFDHVRSNFPETLLLAREPVEWGPTETALSAANLLRARSLAENWEDDGSIAEAEERVPA